MVYRTRASPGCLNCRTRRIKASFLSPACNLLSPRCSQCARAGLQCTGYRSQSDIRFRNETQAVIQKFSPPSIRKDPEDFATNDPSHVPFIPLACIEQIAQRLFEDNFSFMDGSCKGSMKSTVGQPSPASLGGTSVGLAALAVMRKDRQMMHLARKRYCSALHLLARTMQEPIESNVENSVAAGFILSMFEVLVSEEKSSTSYLWLQHAHGTAALLACVWPRSQVPSDETRALLDVSYTSILASLISGKPVPQMFLHLAENCEPVGGNPTSNHPLFLSIRLCSIMSSLVNLYVSTNQTSEYSQAQLLASAIASDQALEAWVVSLPSPWGYQTISNEPHYVYGSPWFARTWNYYRLSRILANKIILYGLNAGSLLFQTINPTLIDKYKLQDSRSASVISEFSKEIYISLPAMFDFNCRRPASIPLSLDVFFVVTILQSLVVLTGRSTVLRNWPSSACEQLEGKCVILKEIIIRNLF
ncbi:hypothetical protein DER46DRAFT_551669 [Fusarium sp. MPI-SDFR-AT-0072]|nr:hypothetical protein DER46DRAFT_551669 [Fusarium sp. MPI-SDFR-AT-0072]